MCLLVGRQDGAAGVGVGVGVVGVSACVCVRAGVSTDPDKARQARQCVCVSPPRGVASPRPAFVFCLVCVCVCVPAFCVLPFALRRRCACVVRAFVLSLLVSSCLLVFRRVIQQSSVCLHPLPVPLPRLVLRLDKLKMQLVILPQ